MATLAIPNPVEGPVTRTYRDRVHHITDRLINWASILEPATQAQAEATASLPFIYPHVALMPDAHLGKGATVGSVIPTLGAIIPAAVGVDIGCGMAAVRTQYHRDQLPGERAGLRQAIERAVPLSAGGYNTELTATAEPARGDPGQGGRAGRLRPGASTPATGRCSSVRSAPATTSSR